MKAAVRERAALLVRLESAGLHIELGDEGGLAVTITDDRAHGVLPLVNAHAVELREALAWAAEQAHDAIERVRARRD